MESKRLCSSLIKSYENSYGVHIVFYLNEQTGTLPSDGEVTDEQLKAVTGDFVGKITYHVNTNSCTIDIGTLHQGYAPNELAKELVSILKSDWSASMLKEMASVENYTFKPVWCKQLNRHFM